MRALGVLLLTCIVVGSPAPALASTFSVVEDTSPFPAPVLHPPYGAQSMLTVKASCAKVGKKSLVLPTGADTSFISVAPNENGLNAPLYLSAEQDGIPPKSIFVRFRYAEITASGVVPAGGSIRLKYPTPTCPGGITVTFEDVLLATPPTLPSFNDSGLVPFPAEKN